MEAVIETSSPATADKEQQFADARADLLKILGFGPHFGGPMEPSSTVYTWCACCGSQYLRADGTIYIGQMATAVDPAFTQLESILEKRYGPAWKERVPAVKVAEYKKYRRINLPGATFAFMEKDKAIELLFDEKHRNLADGYQIEDKDQGYPVSVIWMNK